MHHYINIIRRFATIECDRYANLGIHAFTADAPESPRNGPSKMPNTCMISVMLVAFILGD